MSLYSSASSHVTIEIANEDAVFPKARKLLRPAEGNLGRRQSILRDAFDQSEFPRYHEFGRARQHSFMRTERRQRGKRLVLEVLKLSMRRL